MDIGSSSQPLAPTKKQSEALVVCSNCKAKNTLKNSIQTQSCSLEKDLIETVLICPDCGHLKHVYYMSKELQAKQIEMGIKIKVLSRCVTQENLNKVIELRENYKKLFDDEQSKYQAVLNIKNILGDDDGRTA